MSEEKRTASDRPEGPTNASELLTHQFGTVYALIERNTAGMSHADSLVQPQPTGNCANWILAHLTVVHNTLMGLLGEPPVWDHQRLTLGTLYEPIEREEQAFDWDTMRSRFVASRDRCLAALTRLTPGALARRMTGPFGDPTTMAGLLGTLAVHQTYHAGQLAVSRRVAGLEGAVKAPGQAA